MKLSNLIIFFLIISLTSCVTESYQDLRSDNRYNISKIKVGNLLSEVEQIMGDKIADGDISGVLGEKVRNPYKIENIELKGSSYLIYYYYTERIGDKSWETGVSPIVFLNNKVIGIGWRSMESLGLESPSRTLKIR
jgi:hypothetical protein